MMLSWLYPLCIPFHEFARAIWFLVKSIHGGHRLRMIPFASDLFSEHLDAIGKALERSDAFAAYWSGYIRELWKAKL